YSFEVENHVRRLITTEKPEIAYVLHYLRKLSPSLLVGIKKENIPIVVRLSDYGMICPETHLFRNNEICTLCLGNNFMPSIRKKCVKNSKLFSAINVFSSAIHSQLKFFNFVDLFVCTNEFMYDMMVKAGYSKERLVVIPTFTDLDMFTPRDVNNKNKYIVYLGRIEFNKGVHVLIEAFNIFLKNNKSSVIL
ncbi:MAG: glycosyltransferase family 4 protein, partial [Deltaproteobacteria bacterium]|nr:glycosyltransferase family 4 protein [Deltaproteobacteria bacterium]